VSAKKTVKQEINIFGGSVNFVEILFQALGTLHTTQLLSAQNNVGQGVNVMIFKYFRPQKWLNVGNF
jgi:hypothetical protein